MWLFMAGWLANLAYAGMDIAMIAEIQGTVQGEVGGKKGVAIGNFWRLKDGETITLGDNSSVKLIFYETGRQELWKGKGNLKISTSGSSPKGTFEMKVEELGSQIGSGIQSFSSVLKSSESVAGAVTFVRGQSAPTSIPNLTEEEQKKLEDAKALYQTMTQKPEWNGSWVPEIYYAGALMLFGKEAEAVQILEIANQKCQQCITISSK